MLGRTFLVILFFWAALTVVTPILIRLSASAKLMDYQGEQGEDGSQINNVMGVLPRRALVATGQASLTARLAPVPAPAPTPTPASLYNHQRLVRFEPVATPEFSVSDSWNTVLDQTALVKR